MARLFKLVGEHWPVMVREGGDVQNQEEFAEPIDDSALAAALGVEVQALPVEPVPDSQILPDSVTEQPIMDVEPNNSAQQEADVQDEQNLFDDDIFGEATIPGMDVEPNSPPRKEDAPDTLEYINDTLIDPETIPDEEEQPLTPTEIEPDTPPKGGAEQANGVVPEKGMASTETNDGQDGLDKEVVPEKDTVSTERNDGQDGLDKQVSETSGDDAMADSVPKGMKEPNMDLQAVQARIKQLQCLGVRLSKTFYLWWV